MQKLYHSQKTRLISQLIIIAFFVVVFSPYSLAQYSSIPLPGHASDAITSDDITALIGEVAYFLIVSSTIIAVIFIVWGGIEWMSAGSDTEKQKKAKTHIQNGIIGALIVLSVGVILQTIHHFVCSFSISGGGPPSCL